MAGYFGPLEWGSWGSGEVACFKAFLGHAGEDVSYSQ